MNRADVLEAIKNGEKTGHCLSCDHVQPCDPWMRDDTCQVCGEHAVSGVQILLKDGRV